ncbi:hypothetical protein BH09BAC3_BH09BAC3_17530 [soil metagenome]
MRRLIDNLKNLIFFKLATIYLRYIIGFAFVFASIVKIKGERFTQISVTDPVGYFFEAMYQSGFYWNFLGVSQFVAGALLMSQRFSTIGAAAFFPIILNVFMITTSVNFGGGTPIVTGLMLLGTIYLLIWDYKKYAILLQRDHTIFLNLTAEPEDKFMTDPIWTITGITFLVITMAMHLIPENSRSIALFPLTISLFLVGVGAFAIAMVRKKRRSSQPRL